MHKLLLVLVLFSCRSQMTNAVNQDIKELLLYQNGEFKFNDFKKHSSDVSSIYFKGWSVGTWREKNGDIILNSDLGQAIDFKIEVEPSEKLQFAVESSSHLEGYNLFLVNHVNDETHEYEITLNEIQRLAIAPGTYSIKIRVQKEILSQIMQVNTKSIETKRFSMQEGHFYRMKLDFKHVLASFIVFNNEIVRGNEKYIIYK